MALVDGADGVKLWSKLPLSKKLARSTRTPAAAARCDLEGVRTGAEEEGGRGGEGEEEKEEKKQDPKKKAPPDRSAAVARASRPSPPTPRRRARCDREKGGYFFFRLRRSLLLLLLPPPSSSSSSSFSPVCSVPRKEGKSFKVSHSPALRCMRGVWDSPNFLII